jgi:hypothetical protein
VKHKNKSKGGPMAKSKKLFGGKENYKEELAEAKAIKSGKVSPQSYAKKEAAEHKRGGGAIMTSKKDSMGEALRGGGAIMTSKKDSMGVALKKGGQVKGSGVAIKGIRPAKMY